MSYPSEVEKLRAVLTGLPGARSHAQNYRCAIMIDTDHFRRCDSRNLPMHVRIVVSGLLALLLAFGISGCSGTQTDSWTEDVELADGRVVTVERTATRGPDEFFRPGRGGTVASMLRFSLNGKTVAFEDPGEHLASLVRILDFVDETPVVVKPIDSVRDCKKYGYPPEGLIAFRYSGDRWIPISVSTLPKTWKINLIRSYSDLMHVRTDPNATITLTSNQDRGGERAFLAAKREYTRSRKQRERPNHVPPDLGDSLGELIRYESEEERACGRFQVQPDPRRDAQRAAIDAAVRDAPTREAALQSDVTMPREVPHQEYNDRYGENLATGIGHRVASCRGVVRGFRRNSVLVGRTGGDSTHSTEIVLEDPSGVYKRIEVPASFGAPFVACDNADLYVTFRYNRSSIRMVWLSREGIPRGAANVVVPGNILADEGGPWMPLWNIAAETGEIEFSLIEVTEPETYLADRKILRERRYHVSLMPQR